MTFSGGRPTPQRADDRGDKDGDDPEILACHHPHGSSSVPGRLPEEHRQDQEIVDVRKGEHPDSLTEQPKLHVMFPLCQQCQWCSRDKVSRRRRARRLRGGRLCFIGREAVPGTHRDTRDAQYDHSSHGQRATRASTFPPKQMRRCRDPHSPSCFLATLGIGIQHTDPVVISDRRPLIGTSVGSTPVTNCSVCLAPELLNLALIYLTITRAARGPVSGGRRNREQPG
jgi:hypothetical protein